MLCAGPWVIRRVYSMMSIEHRWIRRSWDEDTIVVVWLRQHGPMIHIVSFFTSHPPLGLVQRHARTFPCDHLARVDRVAVASRIDEGKDGSKARMWRQIKTGEHSEIRNMSTH